MDKISVIVPIYNSETYLKECIESIIKQTYRNFEVLLIDDGSEDSSLNICYELCNKYENIKVFTETHKGVSVARNFGISKATGKYVCFVDSDDIIDTNFLQTLINLIAKYNSDIAEVDFKYMNQNKSDKRESVKVYNSIEMANRLYSANGVRTCIITNKLFNIKLFKNIKFENLENEDEFIIHKLLFSTTKNIVVTNQKLYIYRIHENSRQTNFNKDKFKILDVFEERENYFSIDKDLLRKNKIAKLDMIIYLSYICSKNRKTTEQKHLKQEFLKEYRKLNVNLNIKRKLKYYIFIKKPSIVIKIISLKNRKKYE